jgi:eukaryotic-like serine/threonine-protein kinase
MSEQGSAQRSTGPDPLIGRVIADRFRIVSLIARGGMGKVYRAEQSPLGRVCAIKVLNPNYSGDADPEFHRRFFREASITSKITHPNCVTIFDYGKTDDDIYFMAMEYLEGQTLHMALRDIKTMAEIRVGRIATQICRAVREAHKLGVIHRDLKPANIFLVHTGQGRPSDDEDDFVKVLDFGLVKHLSERPEEQLTQTGLFMGSPKYMAPEQIQGGHVDERTDIYSLGIILYEMLAGKVPFERASSVNILMAHVSEKPPTMREVNPNLVCSPAFEEIVMSCISKDPKERFSSMDHLLSAIRRAHGGSVTGQLVASSATGPFRPSYGSYAGISSSGAAVAAGGTSSVGRVPAAIPRIESATSSHTPAGLIRTDEPRSSRGWVFVGVVVAALIGGGLGMLLFKWTTPPPPPPPPPVTAPVTSAVAPLPGMVPPVASATKIGVDAKLARVLITSDPPGAKVSEGGKDACAPTPCDVVFEGEAADSSRVHKILVSKNGFRPETRTVRSTDAPLHVKLVKGAADAGP